MNRLASRFTLSSPAPIKGDFFLTSRFETQDEESPLNRGSPKVVDARYDSDEKIQIDEVEKHGSIRNLF
jgi:hypothetical protein